MSKAAHQLPPELFTDLDRSGTAPLYHQLAARLQQAILRGELPAGTRIENEVALSARLGLSRPTIRRAIQELVDKGLLVRRRGIGTQVVDGQLTRNIELTSLYEDLERAGQRPQTTLLTHELRAADERIAAILGVTEGDEVLHISRLRSADGTPIAVLDNVLPAPFTDITAEELREHGLYQLFRARGVRLRVAKQRISARAAVAAESELLELHEGAAVLSMSRTAFDSAGRIVEYGDHVYQPELYSFEITLVDK